MAASIRDIGEYHDAVIIGRGGFGAVYRAVDHDHGRQVAIKVIGGELDDAARRRFDRERQTMGQLSGHPNIVSVYDSGYTDDGEAFIVMELAEGGSLRQRLNGPGPIPWPEASEIIAAIAMAAHAGHEQGVLHRDIKPDNILIDRFGNPKLTDFGIATVIGSVTAATSATATVSQAAPEVLQGEGSSPAADTYALGSTLFTLLTGRPPFFQSDDDTISTVIGRALTQPPPDLRRVGLPDSLAAAVEQALEKKPDDRQRSSRELAEQLRAVIRSDPHDDPSGASAPWTAVDPGPRAFGSTFVDASARSGADHLRTPARPDDAGAVSRAADRIPTDRLIDPDPTTDHRNVAGRHGDGTASRPAHPLVPLIMAVVAGLAGVAVFALAWTAFGPGDDPADGTTSSVGQLGSGDAGALTVRIECPPEITLDVQTICSIVSTGAVSGRWHLPGFLSAPEPIGTVPGRYDIMINPTDPDGLSRFFTITATVTDSRGAESSSELQFQVVSPGAEPKVQINCPAQIVLEQSTVCDVLSSGASSGTWEIPGVGEGDLTVVPGATPISVQLLDPATVGQRFTFSASVTNAAGETVAASTEFTVTD